MAERTSRTPPQAGGPFTDAGRIRRGISRALHSETWYSEVVSPGVAACLIGVDADILQNSHVSLLFHQTQDGVEIAAGITKDIALRAFQAWKSSPDKGSQNTFNRDAYMSLYRVFQAAAQGAGDIAFEEIAELFVTALAEQDESWVPFLDRVRGFGDIAGEADEGIIIKKMTNLWKKIPPGMRSSLASFSPEHLFGG